MAEKNTTVSVLGTEKTVINFNLSTLFDYGMMAMNVIERLFAMLVHIGLTVIVYYGVINAKKVCLLTAILLHMLMDTFPAMYQRGVLPLRAVEIWLPCGLP